MQLRKPARNIGRVLAMAVPVVLFPGMAHAHSGGIEFHAALILFAQLVAGPAVIILADIFKGRRRRYLAGFLVGIVCSWAFFLTGHLMGMSDETFDALTEGLSIPVIGKLDAILFYTNFLAIPLAAMAVVWAAYALHGKYRGDN